jgi:hypothetical protein
MRIADYNSHGNKDWVKKNNCAACKHRTPMEKDHCHITVTKPRQKCPLFKEK